MPRPIDVAPVGIPAARKRGGAARPPDGGAWTLDTEQDADKVWASDPEGEVRPARMKFGGVIGAAVAAAAVIAGVVFLARDRAPSDPGRSPVSPAPAPATAPVVRAPAAPTAPAVEPAAPAPEPAAAPAEAPAARPEEPPVVRVPAVPPPAAAPGPPSPPAPAPAAPVAAPEPPPTPAAAEAAPAPKPAVSPTPVSPVRGRIAETSVGTAAGGPGGAAGDTYEGHLAAGNKLLASDAAKALVHFEYAARLAPGRVEARSRMGDAEARLGHLQDAAIHYQTALKSHLYGPAMIGLARVHDRMGHADDARHWYARYLDVNSSGSQADEARRYLGR